MSLDFYKDLEMEQKITTENPDTVEERIEQEETSLEVEDVIYLASDDIYYHQEVQINESDANAHEYITIEYAEDDGQGSPIEYHTTLTLDDGNYNIPIPIHRKVTFQGENYVKESEWNHNISSHLYEAVS